MVVKEVEGDGADSLWRELCVLEGKPGSEEEVAMLRKGVVARTEGICQLENGQVLTGKSPREVDWGYLEFRHKTPAID